MSRLADADDILDVMMETADFSEPLTIRAYFRRMVLAIWREGEGFSGKRPFGNSGWHYDVYAALVKSGHIRGAFDEHGCLDRCDHQTGDRLVREALERDAARAPETPDA